MKRALQIVMAVLGLVPVVTGLISMSGTGDPLYAAAGLPSNLLLDSNLRFFGGVWFGLGLAIYWLIPRIETQTVLFRAIWIMIFCGGIGRLLSMALAGAPPLPFIGFTALEIIGAPLFIVWQARIAKRA
jgi:uncharacterized protein YjeT (DUF2065 family)